MGNYHLQMLRSNPSYASNLNRLSSNKTSVINIQNNFYGQGMGPQAWGGGWDSCGYGCGMPMYYDPYSSCGSSGGDKFSNFLTQGAFGLQMIGSIINLFKGNKT